MWTDGRTLGGRAEGRTVGTGGRWTVGQLRDLIMLDTDGGTVSTEGCWTQASVFPFRFTLLFVSEVFVIVIGV